MNGKDKKEQIVGRVEVPFGKNFAILVLILLLDTFDSELKDRIR